MYSPPNTHVSHACSKQPKEFTVQETQKVTEWLNIAKSKWHNYTTVQKAIRQQSN
jgi:hypothetical protein